MANLHAFSFLLASDTPTILHNSHVMAGFQDNLCKPVAECQTNVVLLQQEMMEVAVVTEL